jgi:tetratricopeptide (TPR) repeat protein
VADQNDPMLDELFAALAGADDPQQAAFFEAEVWKRWHASGRDDVDSKLELGMTAMNSGDARAALRAFGEVVEVAPDFAEGWNKRATLYYLMGDYPASIEDIERTLALEPRHFGALSGLALIHEAQGRPFEALEALEKVVRVHPRLGGLQERIDRLTRQLGESV